jgi:putrescine aminotransferase
MSGLWCVNVGYGQQALIEAATRQLQELPFYNAFFQTATPPAIELAELLAEVTPPQFQHVFFAGSGSEGNDTVVRMVRRYWDLLGQPQRQVIISRHNAYHGSTMAGASLGGMSGMHAQGGLPIPGIVHIEQPYWWELGRRQGLTRRAFGLQARLAGREDPRSRPRQGGGLHRRAGAGRGRRDHPAGHLLARDPAHLRQVRHPAGQRRGHLRLRPHRQWFGCETMGFKPDLMTFAKGVTSGYIPLGGVMVGDRVAKVLIEQGGEFNHGYTYSGHPVACAVGWPTSA